MILIIILNVLLLGDNKICKDNPKFKSLLSGFVKVTKSLACRAMYWNLNPDWIGNTEFWNGSSNSFSK